ncbi:MAG: MCE family protein [Nocardia sp.]|nr:MCE family protein [Nocardia sp.]
MITRLWPRLVRRRILLANLGLIVVLLIGCAYLSREVLRVNFFQDKIHVTVDLATSGGLLPGNDVTYRGTRVGKVTSVRTAGDGVAAVAEIDSKARIPVGGAVHVGRLSAAGEQYLDFRPDADTGPYLSDGAVIERSRTSTPVPITNVLTDMSDLVGGMNPERLSVVVDELDKALAGGPDKLRNTISGISQAMAGLEQMLPQTKQLVENLEVIASTTQHAQPDLGSLTAQGGVVFEQAAKADGELRKFLNQAPGQLSTLNSVVAQNQDPLTNVVTNMVAITKAAKLRQPAIEALFPSLRDGVAALGIPVYGGVFHTLADIWPRPTCDYGTVPVPTTEPVRDTRLRLYNYCETKDPSMQIRGSANAPRPNVPDNTAGPPPGVTGNELSRPMPPDPTLPGN